MEPNHNFLKCEDFIIIEANVPMGQKCQDLIC